MKIKNTLAALLLLSLTGCYTYAAPRAPILNGVLQTDLNANGKSITNQDSATHSFSWGLGNSPVGMVQGQANTLIGYENAPSAASFGSGNFLSGYRNAYLSPAIGNGTILHGYQNAYSGDTILDGNVMLGYGNAQAASYLGVGNNFNGYLNGSVATTINEGNVLNGYRNANQTISITTGNVLEGWQNANAAISIVSGNVLLGLRNGYAATSIGYGNVLLGNQNGYTASTIGDGNVFLGMCSESPFSANPAGNLQIGSLLFATGMNTSPSARYGPTGGKVGINSTNLLQTLNVGGSVTADIYYVNASTNFMTTNGAPIVTNVPAGLSPVGLFGQLVFFGATNTLQLSGAVEDYTNFNAFFRVSTNKFIANTNLGTLTNTVAGWYRVSYMADVIPVADNNNDELEVAIVLNGIHSMVGGNVNTLVTAIQTTMTDSTIVYLPLRTGVGLHFRNLSDASSTVDIRHCSLSIGTP